MAKNLRLLAEFSQKQEIAPFTQKQQSTPHSFARSENSNMTMNERRTRNLPGTPRKQQAILVAGQFLRNDGYHMRRPAGDTAWLIIITLEGKGLIRLGSSEWDCVPGDVVIVPPGLPQDYATAERGTWTFDWCHFLPPAHWDKMLRFFDMHSQTRLFHARINDMELNDARLAFERVCRHQETNLFLALNGLEEVLLRVSGIGNENRQHLDARVNQIITWLADHLNETHSLTELAQRVHLSPSRLSHLFKEQTGRSIVEMLTGMRLNQAMRLLEFTTLSVSEIAGEVGFQSPFYFTTRFTEHYGMSPTEYKKQIKTQAPH
jgi:AraC family transcriptional regulator of arabinose operon